jgi:hypothetical protein
MIFKIINVLPASVRVSVLHTVDNLVKIVNIVQIAIVKNAERLIKTEAIINYGLVL